MSVTASAEERFGHIRKYLQALFEALANIDHDQNDSLLGKLGSGAEVIWLRNFQSFVNQRFDAYQPDELIDWKERQDEELQSTGRRLGTDIERCLKIKIINNLQILFSKNWELEIGPIQRACADRAREQMEKEYKEGLEPREISWTDQFFLSDYKSIIEKYWVRKPDKDVDDFVTFEDKFAIDVG